jgi:hypothetical protein
MHTFKDAVAIASFGQYLHWSQMQYEHFKTYGEDSADADYVGALVHWLASLYVVIEGWKELGQDDRLISALLTKYDDYYQRMRRFRNAVFHYQASPLSEKLTEFLEPTSEVHPWAMALQFEFQRVLLGLVPTDDEGEEIKHAIGWWPNQVLVLAKAKHGTKRGEWNPSLRFLSRIHSDE